MADPGPRENKLIQYLNEAYGKEKQLETALREQITVAMKPALQKRLKDHLKETQEQAKGLERRIKQLGGKADTSNLPGPDSVGRAVTSAANKAMSAAKGPIQALSGTSAADNNLRHVRKAIWNEMEEIAHYDVIEQVAQQLGDPDTAKLAREFRRQEERMLKFLQGQIKSLVGMVIREEIPANERKPAAEAGSSSRGRASSRGAASRAASSRSPGAKNTGARAKASSSRSSASAARKSAPASRSRAGASRATKSSS